jgi:hypothetical protein
MNRTTAIRRNRCTIIPMLNMKKPIAHKKSISRAMIISIFDIFIVENVTKTGWIQVGNWSFLW